MGDALLLAESQTIEAAPAAALDAVRISVRNGSIARHFWESALGLHCVGTGEVSDAATREVWGIREGAVRVTRLEIGAEVFPKIELLEWEGCSELPIRDAKHPWDYGLLALRIPVWNLESRLQQLSHWRCRIDRNGKEEASVTSPSGERIVLRQGGEAAVVAVVPSLDAATQFFRSSVVLPNGIPPRVEKRYAGAASVDQMRSLRLGSLEVMELKRSADPRPAAATESRMHAGYTGYCMLSVAMQGVIGAVAPRPVGSGSAAIAIKRAPGGIPVEVFSVV